MGFARIVIFAIPIFWFPMFATRSRTLPRFVFTYFFLWFRWAWLDFGTPHTARMATWWSRKFHGAQFETGGATLIVSNCFPFSESKEIDFFLLSVSHFLRFLCVISWMKHLANSSITFKNHKTSVKIWNELDGIFTSNCSKNIRT